MGSCASSHSSVPETENGPKINPFDFEEAKLPFVDHYDDFEGVIKRSDNALKFICPCCKYSPSFYSVVNQTRSLGHWRMESEFYAGGPYITAMLVDVLVCSGCGLKSALVLSEHWGRNRPTVWAIAFDHIPYNKLYDYAVSTASKRCVKRCISEAINTPWRHNNNIHIPDGVMGIIVSYADLKQTEWIVPVANKRETDMVRVQKIEEYHSNVCARANCGGNMAQVQRIQLRDLVTWIDVSRFGEKPMAIISAEICERCCNCHHFIGYRPIMVDCATPDNTNAWACELRRITVIGELKYMRAPTLSN